MTIPVVLGAADKEGLGTTAPWLLGIGLVVGLAVMAAAVFRTVVSRAEASSRGDQSARLRALDELAALGGIRPEDYEARRSALLREV